MVGLPNKVSKGEGNSGRLPSDCILIVRELLPTVQFSALFSCAGRAFREPYIPWGVVTPFKLHNIP